MMLNLAVADAPELLLLDLAGEQRLERPAVDRARKPEPGRNFPAPLRGFVPALGVIIADRIIAGDIAGLASSAPRMDPAALAGRRPPTARPCRLRVRPPCGAIIS